MLTEFEPGGRVWETLKTCLIPAVGLRTLEILQRGGPSDLDWERVARTADIIGSQGDALLFRTPASKHSLGTAEVFNRLADAIAVMAFAPGGVRFLGEHFEVSGEWYVPANWWVNFGIPFERVLKVSLPRRKTDGKRTIEQQFRKPTR